MSSEIILVKNKDKTIPASLVQTALEEHTSSMGTSMVHPKEGLIAEGDKAIVSLTEFEAHQNQWKDRTVVYYFNERGTVTDEEIQPFGLIVEGEIGVCAAFLAGSFGMKKDGQIEEITFIDEYLRPTLETLWEQCGRDVDKFSEALESKVFRMQLEAMCSLGKGTVVLMLSDGNPHIYTKSSEALSEPWGFASDALKHLEKPAAEVPVAQPTVKKKFGGIKASVDKPDEANPRTAVPVVPPASEPAVKVKPKTEPNPLVTKVGATTVIHKGPIAAEAATATASTKLMAVRPGSDWGMKRTKKWYHTHNHGLVPENVSQRPPIFMSKDDANKMGRGVVVEPATNQQYKSFQDAAEALKTKVKDTETKHIPAAPTGTVVTVPVSPIKTIEDAKDIVQHAKEVMDPAAWAKLEAKYPNFAAKMGCSPMHARRLPKETRLALGKLNSGVHLIVDAWMNSDFQLEQALEREQALLKKYETKEKKAEAVAAEQPKQRKFGGIRS